MTKTWQILVAILWLQLSWANGKNGVEQNPRHLGAQEGDVITINCSYSIGMTTLHWMRQNPGGGIVSLFTLSLEMKKKGRISTTINTKERRSALHISAAQPRDSAVYLCAVETQCSPSIWGPYPNSEAETSFLLILVFPDLSASFLGQMISSWPLQLYGQKHRVYSENLEEG